MPCPHIDNTNVRLDYLYMYNYMMYVWQKLGLLYCIPVCYCKVMFYNNVCQHDVLDLFGNPLTQEPEYRLYLIYHVPSLEILDRKGTRLSFIIWRHSCNWHNLYDVQIHAYIHTYIYHIAWDSCNTTMPFIGDNCSIFLNFIHTSLKLKEMEASILKRQSRE